MNDQPPGQHPGRPPVLDEDKRRTVIAMVANGSSRRMAAAYIGCAPSTITRTAARDPEFAAQLGRAECNVETEALALIRKAARNECHWRAAAWILERKNPIDFAPRKPDVLTEPQVRKSFDSLAVLLDQDLPEEKYEQLLRHLDQIRLDYPETPRPPEPWSLWASDATPEIPSADGDFATDPTKEADRSAELETSETAEKQGLTSAPRDAI